MKRYVCYVFAFLLVLPGCKKQTKIQLKEFSKIVFLSNRDAPKRQFDIFIMNPDGSNQINLTTDLQSVNTLSQPVLSPDGKKILFLAFDRKHSLQILNIADRSITNLTEIYHTGPRASFSPQGDKIIFIRRIDGRRQIFVINSDGSIEQNLSNPEYDEFDPAFSSDGSRVLFVSKQKDEHILNIINANGTQRKDLIRQNGEIRFPAFSPDDEFIAFNLLQHKKSGIYLMKSNGKKLKNLINGGVISAKLAFTQDGSQIVFLSRQRGMKYSDVCTIKNSGKDYKNLTMELNVINQQPLMTPDGHSIIFHSVKYNDCDIYSVDVDGGNLINLTNHPKWDQNPSL